MSTLSQEARNIQNPGLGAALLWRFCCGYSEAHQSADPLPLPLVFVVIPAIFHSQTEAFVKGTQKASGLRAFASKFGESKTAKQDVLLALHERVLRFRSLTLQSLKVAIATKLLTVQKDGRVIALSTTSALSGMSSETKRLMTDAEKLGAWCAPLTLHEVSTALKLRF